MKYVCSRCGHEADTATRAAACGCGGLWDLDYRPPVFDPDRIDRSVWGMFRYHEWMALENETWRDISLGEGMTPVVPFGGNILLKMDYFMPTLSFKDRGAAVLIAHCRSIGVDKVVQDSSGNAGNSVAAYCGRAGIGCEIFVPQGTSPKKIAMIASHGAEVTVVPGSRDDCADACREKARREGLFYASHVYNPFFYEGTKTYIYEVYEQLRRIPKTVFIPLGNGTLFIGIVKGLEHLAESGCLPEFPRIVAVQSECCDPIAKAAVSRASHPAEIRPCPTMAEGIAIGKPMRGDEILAFIYKYNMEVTATPEAGILDARAALAAQGIYAEHTTAATYAAYLEYSRKNGTPPDSLIPICGAGLKSDK
ncbi:threonine synthase [Breznakiella homolactica]|uniref:Threonine synthase n=1 Tax=Breznakiella homolactica TaxID=2798577 RepID=A0A7T8BAJ3_9SPIR|nr:threonine synthase [Breznakiella homolactica]QQO09426.1 threonine synthase [Breznakiella homolactica]